MLRWSLFVVCVLMRLIYSMTVYILCVTSPRVLEGLNQNFDCVIFVGVVLLYLTIKSHNIPIHSTPLLSSALYQQRSFPLLIYIYLLYVSIHTLLEYTCTYTCPLPSSLPPNPFPTSKNPPKSPPPTHTRAHEFNNSFDSAAGTEQIQK